LRGSFRLAPLITAIGMSIVLSNFLQVAQGPRNKPIPPSCSGRFTTSPDLVTVSWKQMLIVAVTA
jgi:branched-chain amino acid transport system permease protein